MFFNDSDNHYSINNNYRYNNTSSSSNNNNTNDTNITLLILFFGGIAAQVSWADSVTGILLSIYIMREGIMSVWEAREQFVGYLDGDEGLRLVRGIIFCNRCRLWSLSWSLSFLVYAWEVCTCVYHGGRYIIYVNGFFFFRIKKISQDRVRCIPNPMLTLCCP